MPNPSQLRRERLETLAAAFKNQKVEMIDLIYNKALELFPHVTEKTRMSYARAVYRLLKRGSRRSCSQATAKL